MKRSLPPPPKKECYHDDEVYLLRIKTFPQQRFFVFAHRSNIKYFFSTDIALLYETNNSNFDGFFSPKKDITHL